jgi:hypothetical protein
MPKVTTLQTNFTAGEISPKLYGRVDVARYQNGAKKMRDTIPQVYGGAKRRDGSLFVNEVKTSAKQTRLIPFIYNENTAYMLEFGDLYMRVYKDGAILGAPYEIATPFTEAMLFDMDYTQGADTMFLFQESLAPRRLRRFGDTSWTLDVIPFTETPFEEPGSYPAATLTPSAATPVGGACTLTAGASVFVAGDVGSSVKINGGIVKITGYTSGTSVAGVINQELSSTVAAPANAWSLHAPAWSASRGYPRTGTLYEQRLVVGGSPTFPQTIWGSSTAAYLDFTMGVNDDDAFAFTIASDQINPIQYLASSRSLVAFTSGGEFTVAGGLEKPLAPTNAQIRQRSNYGCARVRPLRIRDAEMFIQRAGAKVRSFAYNVANDDWTAPDIAVMAEHLTSMGIVDLCWQQEPTSIIWLVRTDGVLVSVTYDKDQDVVGWAAHTGFNGVIESVATIPDADSDQLWLVVARTINGSIKRYVERFVPTVRLDSALVATAGSPTTVWTGLTHLEGESVDVVGDDAYVGRYTVAAGQITTTKAITSASIGLPFENRVELLDPEIQSGMGSASGNYMRTNEVTARFFETTGASVNGQDLIFRRFGTNADVLTPQLFSGVTRIENLGWARGESELVITQDKPMPFHLLSITRKFTVNDG